MIQTPNVFFHYTDPVETMGVLADEVERLDKIFWDYGFRIGPTFRQQVERLGRWTPGTTDTKGDVPYMYRSGEGEYVQLADVLGLVNAATLQPLPIEPTGERLDPEPAYWLNGAGQYMSHADRETGDPKYKGRFDIPVYGAPMGPQSVDIPTPNDGLGLTLRQVRDALQAIGPTPTHDLTGDRRRLMDGVGLALRLIRFVLKD